MRCKTQEEADAKAAAGAARMAGEGYRARQSSTDPFSFAVLAPSGRRYRVRLAGRLPRPSCDCPFFLHNARFATCKHVAHVVEEVAAVAALVLSGRDPGETFVRELPAAAVPPAGNRRT